MSMSFDMGSMPNLGMMDGLKNMGNMIGDMFGNLGKMGEKMMKGGGGGGGGDCNQGGGGYGGGGGGGGY